MRSGRIPLRILPQMIHGRPGWIALAASIVLHALLFGWNPGRESGDTPHVPFPPPSLLDLPPPRSTDIVAFPLPEKPPPRRAAERTEAPLVLSRYATRPFLAREDSPEVDLVDAPALPAVSSRDAPSMPELIHAPEPPYPREARRRRREGTVVLALLVDEGGRVAEARIARSSGYPSFDDSALFTARGEWRFRPAVADDRPVARWVRVPVRFTIRLAPL